MQSTANNHCQKVIKHDIRKTIIFIEDTNDEKPTAHKSASRGQIPLPKGNGQKLQSIAHIHCQKVIKHDIPKTTMFIEDTNDGKPTAHKGASRGQIPLPKGNGQKLQSIAHIHCQKVIKHDIRKTIMFIEGTNDGKPTAHKGESRGQIPLPKGNGHGFVKRQTNHCQKVIKGCIHPSIHYCTPPFPLVAFGLSLHRVIAK